MAPREPHWTEDPPGYKPPLGVGQLLCRYARGERYFCRTDIAGGDDPNTIGDFDQMDLSGSDFRSSIFHDCSFNGSALRQSNLSYSEFPVIVDEMADERRVASFRGAVLTESKLEHAWLPEANLEGAVLTSSHCSYAYFAGANLSHARLEQADLQNADCRKVCFSGATLYRANLKSLNAARSNFQGVILHRANLQCANFEHADIQHASLDRADLRAANFSNASLKGASLSGAIYDDRTQWPDDFDPKRAGGLWIGPGANLDRAYIEDIDLWNVDLSRSSLKGARLNRAKFSHCNFSDADLRECHMHGAQFHHTDLSGADMSYARVDCSWFWEAKLHNAKLIAADLSGSRHFRSEFLSANLDSAYLTGASFQSTLFNEANLHHVYLKNTRFYDTNFTGVRLEAARLRAVRFHETDVAAFCSARIEVMNPCDVDWGSVVRSLHAPNLREFLVSIGLPVLYANYLVACARSLDPRGLLSMMQSAFISYGGPDEAFAKKLRDGLHENGVRTWLFAENAVPGAKLHRTMTRGVNDYDRVILVCSRSSLSRSGVLNEIEQSLAREAREGGASVLIPIRLDDFLFDGWMPDRVDMATEIRDRVVADFRGAMDDEARFESALAKLLGALGPAPGEAR